VTRDLSSVCTHAHPPHPQQQRFFPCTNNQTLKPCPPLRSDFAYLNGLRSSTSLWKFHVFIIISGVLMLSSWMDPYPSRSAKGMEQFTSTVILVMLYTGSVDYDGEQSLMFALVAGCGIITAVVKVRKRLFCAILYYK
jgi:hypothetical protein